MLLIGKICSPASVVSNVGCMFNSVRFAYKTFGTAAVFQCQSAYSRGGISATK